MRQSFQVWDVDAGNMIGVSVSLFDALDEVRDLLEVNGHEYAADLSLARRGADAGGLIAEGAALLRFAFPADGARRSA